MRGAVFSSTFFPHSPEKLGFPPEPTCPAYYATIQRGLQRCSYGIPSRRGTLFLLFLFRVVAVVHYDTLVKQALRFLSPTNYSVL